ncbi:hypothetical protein BU204_11625 [Actinophytocola xanthii]|uniref:Uncharacterized protein n=1 Tax=Actinophytocola xanthii TaxID=1912961 RepID=A0A1Q8CSV7_9PSEU|nr:hypothetical protein BU204_11625 [Actinophytocola xanthii]
MVAVMVLTLLLSIDDPPVYYTQGKVPTSSGQLSDGGPVVACPTVTTNEPDLVIEAEGDVAFAEYYRKNNLFLVYDNAPDGNSAILQLTAPSGSRTDWYNTKGHTCNGRKRPKAMVVGKVEHQDLAAARVCVGEWGDRGRVPPEHCGKMVHLPSADQNAGEAGS